MTVLDIQREENTHTYLEIIGDLKQGRVRDSNDVDLASESEVK